MSTNPFGAPVNAQDDTFAVDLTNVEGSNYLPPGLYPGRCTEVEKTTSNAGNPMFVWTFSITTGEHAGKSLKLHTALTPNALWKVQETLEALALTKGGEEVRFTKKDVIGKPVAMIVVDDEYNGRVRSSLDMVQHPDVLPQTASSGASSGVPTP